MAIKIKDGYAWYPCGCRFKVAEMGPPIRLDFTANLESVDFTCERTWDLFAEGNTKGVFQLETRFGQQYSKKLKPHNIEHLAALAAILRPGCLNAIRDGKSVTDHFIDRKNREEDITYFHPSLVPILGETFGEMVYQEQAMKIAQELAGFDLKQADILRKAIGKKKADVMASVKEDFIDGCEKVGILNKGEAEQIWEWIEKSQRYSFNKSHAISYAMQSYVSAYLKAHFPISFFTSWLWYAKDKQKKFDEIKLLVANARLMDITILPPDFRNSHSHFKNLYDQLQDKTYNPYDNKVYFGFADIKGVGISSLEKMEQSIYQAETMTTKNRKDWSWGEFLVYLAPETKSTVVTGLIESGAVDYFKVSRQKMLFEYERMMKLTKKEVAWIRQFVKPQGMHLDEILWEMLLWYESDCPADVPKPCANKNRVAKVREMHEELKNPPYSLTDNPDWLARVEDARLGVALTASVLDGCRNLSQANCTCKDFIKHEEINKGIFIAAQIDEIKTHTTQNGDEMAFIALSDHDAQIDAVVFPGEWEKMSVSGVCVEENTVMVGGERSNKGSFIIKKMWQLS